SWISTPSSSARVWSNASASSHNRRSDSIKPRAGGSPGSILATTARQDPDQQPQAKGQPNRLVGMIAHDAVSRFGAIYGLAFRPLEHVFEVIHQIFGREASGGSGGVFNS